MNKKILARSTASLVVLLTLSGCVSFDKVALNIVGDTLSAEGSNTVFTGDNDPKLVGDALPFAIKMYESLSSANPTHVGMSRSVGMLYVMYANAFVAGPADYFGLDRFDEKQAAQKRAVNLYLRGRDFVLKALELKYPGFTSAWEGRDTAKYQAFLPRFKKADVSSLYWFSAGHMAAFSIEPMDLNLSTPVPKVMKLLVRAYELDPDFQKATLDELFVSVYSSLPAELGGDPAQALVHYDRALAKTDGKATGAFLARATSIDLPKQNKTHFVEMLKQVLNVDAEADPDATLVTLLNQERARWYLAQLDDLFIE